jgi:hypothetical protein
MRSKLKNIRYITVILLLSLLSAVFLSLNGYSAEKGKELKVAFDQWPPFTDFNDKNLGICYAITAAAFEGSGYILKPDIIPFKRIKTYGPFRFHGKGLSLKN